MAGGLLDLSFEVSSGGRTYAAKRAQRFPLRMTVPMYLDEREPGMAFVYVQNPSGGVFAGDSLDVCVRAGRESRVHVTTQSATRVCRMDGGCARQDIRFEVGPSAFLESIPDVVIPHAGARLHQRTSIVLHEEAAFVGWELVGPGRRPLGERHSYSRMRFETEAYDPEGHLLFKDALELDPGRRSPLAAGALGCRDYLGTLFALRRDGSAAALVDELSSVIDGTDDVMIAATQLPNDCGAMVRVLSPTRQLAEQALMRTWSACRSVLLGSPIPASRK